MTLGIERLSDGDPIEINQAVPGQPPQWREDGRFSHYDGKGNAVYLDAGGMVRRFMDLSRIRKKATSAT